MRFLILFLIAVLASAQERIVSTSPAITETLYALGLGSKVAGVSTYCHFPREVMSKPKIGTYLRPNIEAILRLRPNLVIVERMPSQAMENLRAGGVTVSEIHTGDVQTNLRMIEEIATAANIAAKGRELRAKVSKNLDRIAAASKSKPPRTVIFIVGRTPGRLDGIVAVGKGSYLNELLMLAGGRNLLSDSAVTYPRVSLESIVRMKPDVIIDMGDMAETQGVTEEHKQSVVRLWKSRPDIPSRVHAVASDIFVVPGPRMVDAAREFHRLIHGATLP